LRNFYGQPFAVPVGGMIDWTGGASPNSNFVLPFGQAISRTTYSAYFAILNGLGLPYGVGDGSTTFNVIDMRGRIGVGLDNMGGSNANRIGTVATDTGTIVGTTIGSGAGSSTHTQQGAEVGVHNHSATSSDSGHTHGITYASGNTASPSTGVGSNASPSSGPNFVDNDALTINTGHANISTTVNNNSGGASSMAWLQPSIMVGKLLRIA
jgi:microcystin-dependent protein